VEKRSSEDDAPDGERLRKREKGPKAEEDDEAEEMEIDEDEEQHANAGMSQHTRNTMRFTSSSDKLPHQRLDPSISLPCSRLIGKWLFPQLPDVMFSPVSR
jgi:hypothetical protein